MFDSSSLLSRMVAMPAAGAILFLLVQGLPHSPCWGVFFLAIVAAWPIWYYQQEYLLFQRRAVLERATPAGGVMRRWFWAGHIARGLQVINALLWGLLTLAFGGLLRPEHWMVLGADILLLALLVGPLHRRLANHLRVGQLGMLVRRWPLFLLNLAVLSGAFLAVDFFIAGAPDSRALSWHTVAEQALADAFALNTCPFAAYVTGLISALDRLTWHFSEVLIPSLPTPGLKYLAWALFLLQAGVFAYAFTRFQLGIVALLDSGKLRLTTLTGESTFSKTFLVTILLLAIPYLYASHQLRNLDLQKLNDDTRPLFNWANPCPPDNEAMETMATDLTSEIEADRSAARRQAAKQIDVALDELFADLEQGVASYLDWYFTVVGEYERLAAVASGDLGQLMTDELERRLFTETGFSERLDRANQAIAQASQSRVSALQQRLQEQTRTVLAANPCGLAELDISAFADLERDPMRASLAAGGGALTAMATAKLLAKKTAAALAGKVAAKKSFSIATGLLAKTAAKKGGSILVSAAGGAALCSPGGVVAVLCGIAAGTTAWLAFDKVFIEIDEAMFRDEMQADILAALNEQKAELATDLKRYHHAAIDAMAAQTQSSTERVFIPARDGL